MTRPPSIVNFERLYLGSWLLSLVGLAVGWNTTKELVASNPAAQQVGIDTMMNIFIAVLALSLVLTLVLWYFTARQASLVAKWIVVVFFVLSLFKVPGLISELSAGELVTGLLALAVLVLDAVAVAMLFRLDARVWFGEVKGGAA